MIKTSFLAAAALAFASLSTSAFAACHSSPGVYTLREVVPDAPAIDVDAFKAWHFVMSTTDEGDGNLGERIEGYGDARRCVDGDGIDETNDTERFTAVVNHFKTKP